MKKLLLALLLMTTAANAQAPPYTYPSTLGTSSVSILPANAQRKRIIFHNPSATNFIAVCPVGPNRLGGSSTAPVVAVINGAGCITLLPYQVLEVSGSSASGPQQTMSSAWVGIASGASTPFTALEFE